MLKKLILVLALITSLFSSGDFVEPSEAFKVSKTESDDKLSLQIKLADSIYLYHDKIKVLVGDNDITSKLTLPKPIEYDGFIVHFDKIIVDVPKSMINGNVTLKYQGCSKAGLCYSPMSETFEFKNEVKTKQAESKKEVAPPVQNETDTIAQTLKDGNVFFILATFFGFGLLLSLTPCVFPMIPILSSIIISHSHSKHGDVQQISASRGFTLSLIYVLSMSAAYTIAGVLAGVSGANIQAMLQNPTVIIVFAAIFVALAFSMFGYYKLEIPHSIQNRIHKKTNKEAKHGVAGIAIMGFLSALIVGPCVAPPLAGALIYISQTGDAILGGAALFVMSLGMGIPLLALGAGAGKYMPKPGGWMDTVSKIFGIVMLAVALWMLERVISSELFMYLSSFLLIGAALYLKAFEHLVARLITTIIFIYGVIAFTGAVSGATNILDPLENLRGGSTVAKQDKFDWTYVRSIKELDEVVKASQKPVMVDFWATWCVSCKELDNITFKDPQVIEELKKYKLVKIDVTNNTDDDKALMKKFNVFGPPALIFYKDGKEETNKRIIGYKTAQEFLNIVK